MHPFYLLSHGLSLWKTLGVCLSFQQLQLPFAEMVGTVGREGFGGRKSCEDSWPGYGWFPIHPRTQLLKLRKDTIFKKAHGGI